MALEYRRRGKRNLGKNTPRPKGRGVDDSGISPNISAPSSNDGTANIRKSPPRKGQLPPSTPIIDNDPSSTYFNITDIPSFLGTGKNTIRLIGSSLLKRNSQIDIEVLDAKGEPIYHEIPNFLSKDGGRLITIWVYSDRVDQRENTAPGTATITVKGRNTSNREVIWVKEIPVRVNEKTSSEIIFDEKTLPTAQVSSSLRPFKSFELNDGGDDLGQGRKSTLTKATASFSTKYQKSTFGDDVVITKTSGNPFTSEMIGGEIRFDLSSQTVFPRQTNVTQPTEFTSSILSVSSSNILQIKDELTGSLNHVYRFTDSDTIPTKVEFFSSASQGTTANLQTAATFTISNTQPISGEVHQLRTSVKSKGLGTEFETIATNNFNDSVASFSYTIPIPSKHIGDPKTIRIEFLNSKNEPSETFIIIEDIVFPGSTTFIGGKGSLITGSIFISNALGSGIEIGGASSGFLRSVGYEGFTSASLGKGPGGFLIYSGSGNLQVGVDQMDGVGFEFVGDNDNSHIKFTTSGSGELDIKANKFFIGTPGSQFMSGSGGKIEISSSDFHLDPVSNQLIIGTNATIKSSLTVNQIRTPALINGSPSTKTNASSSIDSDGFARFASASIAGFEIISDEIRSSDNALRLKAAGDITASRVLLEGGTITDGVTILGSVTANSIRTPAVIAGNPSTETNASSSIRPDGFARFVSASIGGWDITTASIEGGNLIMRPAGILQTRDFASGLRGWKISSEGNGTAEFENVRIRGTLRTTTFEKESVNAVGGQLWVTNATTLTGSNITANDTTMSVKNASGFVAGEILLAKKVDGTGFQTEYILVNSASLDGDNSNADEVFGRLYVTRGFGSGSTGDFVGDLASTSQSYDEGQVLVSTGLSGSGYIKMNANPRDTATPFMDIVERTGSGLYDVALRARIGDLSGLAGNPKVFGSTNPGFGLATDNVFLQGGIIAKTGSIAGIKMESGKLFTGQGVHSNSNTGFYIDSGSKFSLGDKLTWNGTSLTVRGQIRLESGTTVEQAINDVTASATAKSLQITTDSSTYSFDDSSDTSATPNVISFVVSQQNLSATIATSDITITKAGGSTISTPSLGGTSNIESGSGQQSGSLSFSGLSLNKTDLPLTLSVTKDGITDTTTIFKIQGGADGSDGTDAVTAFLTNESHTFPANSSGVVSDFSGGVTDMIVFEGVTDSTSNYSFSRASTTSVSSSISSNRVTVTSMAHDSGSVVITATSASTSLVKTMSLAKSNAGSDGSDGAQGAAGLDGSNAKSLVASVSSQVFSFDDSSDSTATPTNIIFSFNQQNLNAAIGTSDVTITTQGGSSITGFAFNNTNVTNSGGKFSGIASGSIVFGNNLSSGGMEGTKSHFPLTISATKNGLTDTIKIFKVEGGADGSDGTDGTDAVTAFLTNEAHTFAAQADGTIVSFTDASSSMIVFEGVTDKTANYSYSRTGSAGVTSTLSGTNGNILSISALGHDSGSVVITAVSSSTQLAKTMSLVKSKQGTAGLAGSDAKALQVTVDSQVYSFDTSADTTATPSSISFIINQQNLSGAVSTGNITITKAGGGTITTPSLGGVVSDGSGLLSGSITFDNGASPAAGKVVSKSDLPITIEVTKDSLDDSIKVFKVEGGADGSDGSDGVDGTDAVTVFLTNENHNFPADSGGSIASFAGGITDVKVFEGVVDSSSAYFYSATASTGLTFSHLQSEGGSAGNSTTAGHNHFKITNLTKESGSLTINAVSASTRLIKTMSLTRTKQGADGSDGTAAKLLIGSLDSNIMAFDDSSDTSATPSSVVFSFQQQNLTGAISAADIEISGSAGTPAIITGFSFNNTNVTSGTGIVSGSVSFVGNNNAGGMQQTKGQFPFTIKATKDGLSDTVTIFKVEGGADGSDGAQGAGGQDGTDGVSALTAFLTNDSHTLPLSSSNEIISFAGASTDILVFQGTSDVTNDYTISRTSDSHITTTLSGDTVTITNSTTPFSGSIVVTATSASVTLNKTMSLQVARQGDDGLDGSSAKLLNIISDSQTYAFDNSDDNSATPTSINFTVNQQNLSGTIATSDITITKAGGSTFTTPSLGGSVSNGTGTRTFALAFSSFSKSDLPLTVAVSKDSLSDTTTIFKVQGGSDGSDGAQGSTGTAGTDGTDAVTGFLTNESHTIPANAAGSIATGGLNGAITDMIIFEGITDSTNEYKYNPTGSTGVSFNHLQSAGGSSGNINTVGHNHFAITALTKDSGSLVINATSGSGAQRVLISKTMSFSKSKQGDQGSQGDDGAQGSQGQQGAQGDDGAQGSQGSQGDAGAKGATGADNQDFAFLGDSIGNIDTTGGLSAGLLMTSEVLGFHNAIAQGDGTNATINDFTSFLDNNGNFYLGSGSGALGAGYFAWNNSSKTLLISGSGVDFAVQEFYFGRGDTAISGSNGNIKISGDVELVGRNTPNALYFEDFSQADREDDPSYFNGTANHQADGTGFGFYAFVDSGLSDSEITDTDHGQFFGPVLKAGNNSGNDEFWAVSNTLIALNASSLYEVEVRVKETAGSGVFYAGVTAFSSSLGQYAATTFTPVDKNNTAGGSQYGNSHYFAAENVSLSSDWTIYKGYFKGQSASGNGLQHNSITNPGTIANKANYFSPMFICNYDNDPGQVYIDYIKVTEFAGGGGSTKISGDAISAGTIRSNNLGSDGGTLLSLDAGVAKFGGYNAYNSVNGVVLDGPAAKFAVGKASGNYMRFNHNTNSSGGGLLEINTANFKIDSTGSAIFRGGISGSTILGGTLGIGAFETGSDGVVRRKFTVTEDGAMYATTASISGDITSDSATLGKFTIDQTSIIASGSRMVLDAENYRIQLLNTSFEPLVNINAGTSLVQPSSGGQISETYNMVSSTLSGNASSGNISYTNGTDYPDQSTADNFYVGTSGNHSYIINYNGNSTQTYSRGSGQGSYAGQTLYVEIHSNSSFTSLQHTLYLGAVSAYGYDVTDDEDGLSGPGGFTSVIGDTDILLQDGSTKKAKDISNGDLICAWDDVSKKYNMLSEITQVKTRLVDKVYRVVTESGKSVDVSETHGFYISAEEEIKAFEIVEGETKIFVKDNNDIKLELVTSLEIIFDEHQVYTFSVPGLFNYVSNDIISHNTVAGPQEVTSYLASTTSRTGTVNMTIGTKYYRIRRYYFYAATQGSVSNTHRNYEIKTDFDMTMYFTPLVQGTEINNAGLQVNKSNTKVFRVDASANTDSVYTPFVTLVGGMDVDYFEPRRATTADGDTDLTYSATNSSINQDRSFPITRFVCAFDLHTGASPYLTTGDAIGHAELNVSSVTRTSTGYGYITMQESYSKRLTVTVGGYRDTSNLTSNESSHNFATKHAAYQSKVYFVAKNNDGNAEYDPEYFTMVGHG